MEKSIKSIAVNFGLYLGIALASVTILSYAVNLEILTKWWVGILMFIAIIVFGIISVAKSKSALNGYIDLKQAFTSFFITALLGLVISTLVNVLIFNFIDPDAALVLKEKVIEATVEMMRGFNAPEDAIATAVDQMEAQENQFAIGNLIQSLLIQLVIYSVIGLIVSAIMKKNNPEQA